MPRAKKLRHKEYMLRSGFEKTVALNLESRAVDFKYEEHSLPYEVPASTHVYTPDFLLPSGIFVEAKGKFDTAARKKMEQVIKQHPELDIRMLFMRDNFIQKTSKTRYSTWCEKRGIKYHVSANGEVPDDWLS